MTPLRSAEPISLGSDEVWHRVGAWYRSCRDGVIAATVPTDALPETVQIMTPHGNVAITDLGDGDTLTTRRGDEYLVREIIEVTRYFWVGGDHPDKGVKLGVLPSRCDRRELALPLGWLPSDSGWLKCQAGLTPHSFYQLSIEGITEQDEALILNDVPCRYVRSEPDRLQSLRIRVDDQDAMIHASRNKHSLIKLGEGSHRVTVSAEGIGRHWQSFDVILWDSDGMQAIKLTDDNLSGDQISIDLDRDPENVGFLSIRV